MVLHVKSTGIEFTPQGGSDVNLLDDYEEGTWAAATDNGSDLDSRGITTYTKIGRQVWWITRGHGTDSNWGASNQSASITGLPFQPNSHWAGWFTYTNNQNVQHILPIMHSSSTACYFHQSDGDGNTVTNGQFNTIVDFILCGSFQI